MCVRACVCQPQLYFPRTPPYNTVIKSTQHVVFIRTTRLGANPLYPKCVASEASDLCTTLIGVALTVRLAVWLARGACAVYLPSSLWASG